jgi:hypothetical protein
LAPRPGLPGGRAELLTEVLAMGPVWAIDTGARLVTITSGDQLPTFEEVRDAVLAVLGDPRYGSDLGLVSDHRRCRDAPTTRFVDRLEHFLRGEPRLHGVRWALVFESDAGYGMARMAELRVSCSRAGTELRAFRSIDQAFEWLRVPAGAYV